MSDSLMNEGRYRTAERIGLHRQGDRQFWNCTYIPDIVYSNKSGIELKLQLIVPEQSDERHPLVVYIQGSGWGKQNPYAMLPQLSWLAASGFAVASVRFRESSLALFPACLEDTKEAVRFLRLHAEEYRFDATRVGAWGTSSGGHIAAFLGLTEGQFNSGEYQDCSDAVQAVVDCYGPTDLLTMDDWPGIMKHNAADSPESLLIGGALPENPEKAKEASPLQYVNSESTIPPFLILHGDADDKVPKEQSIALYDALIRAGKEARLVLVEAAGHGNDGGVIGFQTLEIIRDFYREMLKQR